MIHLTAQQISSFLDAELTDASTEIVRLHLASCETCTLAFARAEEQAERLARVLTHDPGAEYFAGFAPQVEREIRTGKVESWTKPTAARAVAATSAAQEPAPPEPKPATEPVAPLPIEHPAEPARAPRRRESDRRPVPTIPWYAAAILVVIAGSVGVMISRPPVVHRPQEEPTLTSKPAALEPSAPEPSPVEPAAPKPAHVEPERVEPAPVASVPAEPPVEPAPVARKTPAAPTPAARKSAASVPARAEMEPELLVPEPMKSLTAVTRVVTVVETTRAAPPAPDRPAVATTSLPRRASAPPAEPDPFATLLSELLDRVRTAQKATAQAGEDPTALNYEAAAVRWEDVVSDLRGHTAQPRARFQLASARFRAWEMHPDAKRAAAAVASLRLYLVFASPGAERDSAKAWLARLSH